MIDQLQQDIKNLKNAISEREKLLDVLQKQEEDRNKTMAYHKYDKKYTDDMIKKLVGRMEFEFLDEGHCVSIGVDGKRPFGNSYISGDVGEILGFDDGDEYDFDDFEREYVFERIAKYINNIIAL